MKRLEDNLLCSFPAPDALEGRKLVLEDIDSELERVRSDNPKWTLLISYGHEVVRVYLFRKAPAPG